MKQQTFGEELWRTFGKITLVAVLCLVGAWIKIWWEKPADPTIDVIAINYERSEYTAIRHVKDIGKVKIVAHCYFACPHVGTYLAGPDSVFYHPDIIMEEQVGQ
jgi:hypothetical protein